jgi:2-polyprenyl-6-hydroxyphenyl methylase/3-demethylubiquinone-9 3-methyltransferase
VEQLPYPAQSFEGILCSSVIEYLDEPLSALRELWRVLKPQGSLVISVPNRRSVVRMAQIACYRATGLVLESPFPSYLAISKNAYRAGQFLDLLADERFRVARHLFGGSVLPQSLNRWPYAGSLIFVLAAKVGNEEVPTESLR